MTTAAPSMAQQWNDLVTVALLGTDRRDPPDADGLLADLVADTARPSPSERMLAHVAAATAIRRAAVIPGPPSTSLAPPEADHRRECVPAAVDRWHHVSTSWPVLEDEWMIVLIENGWRLAAELVPEVLRRHRTDPVRHARVRVAGGPLADWVIEQFPDLGCTRAATVDPAVIVELPELPIPLELLDLLHVPAAGADDMGRALAAGIDAGDLAHAHRAVLVNVLCRVDPGVLRAVEESLDRVDRTSAGAGLASVLADLALTRRRMLDELSNGASALRRPD